MAPRSDRQSRAPLRGRLLLVLATLSALAGAGCASVPAALQPVPDPPVGFAQALEAHQTGSQPDVVWGGHVVAVENLATTTRLTIAKRPLDPWLAPARDARTEGRFLADVEGFIDPTDLPQDTRLTVRGRVVDVETLQIGAAERPAPVVRVSGYERFRDPVAVADPFWSRHDRFHRFNDPFWPRYSRGWPPF